MGRKRGNKYEMNGNVGYVLYLLNKQNAIFHHGGFCLGCNSLKNYWIESNFYCPSGTKEEGGIDLTLTAPARSATGVMCRHVV